MKPFFEKMNYFLRSAEHRAEDEESGAIDSCAPAFDSTEDELLHFLDILPPNPRCWDQFLCAQNVRVPEGKWVRLLIEFVLPPGQFQTIVTAQTFTPVTLTEHRDSDRLTDIEDMGLTRSVLADPRLGWVERAELDIVTCLDPNASDSPRIALVLDGYGKEVVARHRPDTCGDSSYWIPAPDMLEPRDGWTASRHQIVPTFAGDRDEAYFKSLTSPVEDYPGYYRVNRELPFVVAFLLWADGKDEWARDAVRRHDGVHAFVPCEWYDEFAKRMTSWLKLWGVGDLNFSLRIGVPVAVERKYQVSVLAKCVFVKDRPPVINGIVS